MNGGAAALRGLLERNGPIVVTGAHNALSAKLVGEAGFDAVWASGFEISASFTVPDADILTMAESLAVTRTMVSATKVPIIADCDAGYGNAINVIRTVRQYEAAGVAGICLEDNAFPKRCSFYDGRRDLATAEEHAAKIRAAKSVQQSPDFVVIARTEAMIAGQGVDEALRRARAYADAGADMCLIHSKIKDAGEVMAFAQQWDRPTPLVCVPTTYGQTSVDELYAGGYKMVIFANHALRSAVKAMQDALFELRLLGSISAIDHRLVPLTEIYRLVDEAQLREQEREFVLGAAPVSA
jgi:phosphoenolpyruvate phosphomutase